LCKYVFEQFGFGFGLVLVWFGLVWFWFGFGLVLVWFIWV
jgi:hypothetical protein